MPMSLGLTEAATRAIGREVQSGLVPLLDILTVPLDRFGQGIDRLGQRLMDGFGRLTLLLGSLNQVRFGIPVQVTNLAYLQTLTFGLLSLSLTAFLVLVLIFTRLGIMSSQLWQLHVDLDILHDDLVTLTIVTALFGALTVALLSGILGALGKGLKIDGGVSVSITGLPEINLWKLLGLLGLAALGLALIVGFVALLAEAFSLFTAKSLLALAAVMAFLHQMAELLTMFANANASTFAEMAGGLALIVGFVFLLGIVLEHFGDKATKLLEPLGKFIELLGALAAQMAALGFWQFTTFLLGFALMAGLLFAVGIALDELTPFAIGALDPMARLLRVLGDLAKEAADFHLFSDLPTIVATFHEIGSLMDMIASAFSKFTDAAVNAIKPVTDLIETLGKLAAAAAKLTKDQAGRIESVFGAMGSLIEKVSASLSQLNSTAISAIVPLQGLLESLGKLAVLAASFKPAQVVAIGTSFQAMAALVQSLGDALNTFKDEAIKAMGALPGLLDSLGALATLVANFKHGQIEAMQKGFDAMSGLVKNLGEALNLFNDQAIKAIEPLQGLLNSLANLATTLAALSATDILSMGAALMFLASFVFMLAAALNDFSDKAIAAMPALTELLYALAAFATSIHNLTVGDIAMMGIALSMLAGFIAYVGEVSMDALPGLTALAVALDGLNSLMDKLVSTGADVIAVLNAITNQASTASEGMSTAAKVGLGLAGVLGVLAIGPAALAIFQEGGMVEHTGPAIVHEGERVLSRGETQAFEGAAMAPPTSLAAAGVDQSINLGGVTINIHADKLDANNADVLSDTIVARLQEKLASLHTEQLFRTGIRATA